MLDLITKRNDDDRDRLKYAGLFFIVVIIAVVVEPFENGRFDLCVFKGLTNLPCPGCGLTRSFIYLAHFQIMDALRMNPFGPLLFFGWAFVTAKDLLWVIGRRQLPFPERQTWSRLQVGFAVAMIIFGVIRIGFHIHEFEPLHGLTAIRALV